jgi:hypothetical protein
LDTSQMMNLSMQGNPVLPMMIKNVPSTRGRTATWKETMESGVSVRPRSLNKDAGVKKPLDVIRLSPTFGALVGTHHQTGLISASSTIFEYCLSRTIQGSRHTIPNKWKPT